jgi:uncharacterized protein (TIGR02246 family)
MMPMMARATVLRALTIAACASALAACAPKTKVNDPADIAAIGKVRDAFATAWKAGDAAALSALYTADARFMGANEPTAVGPKAIESAIAAQFAQFTPTSIQIHAEKTEAVGDLGYDRGTFHIAMTPKAAGAPATSDSGRYLVILRRQADGSWKLSEDISNSATPMPMPAPVPAAPKKK